MLKMALFDCAINESAVLTKDGAFTLFLRPHPGGFDSSRVPTPGNLPSEAKKMLMTGVSPGGGDEGWAQLALTDAELSPTTSQKNEFLDCFIVHSY